LQSKQKPITSGLYYKHITIIYDDSSTVNKFEASLTDDARVIIYDQHMFIVQTTGANLTFTRARAINYGRKRFYSGGPSEIFVGFYF
jgi:hypothetical protein